MRTPAISLYRRHASGFTLIEVMISILIFSLGMLGTAALQAKAVQFAEQNADRSRAAVLANEMVSSLWAFQSATPDTTFLSNWKLRVSNSAVSGVPNGTGSVATAGRTAVVTITWKAPSAPSGAPSNSYATTVVIQ